MPWVLFFALAALLVSSWWLLQWRERHLLEQGLRDTSRQVGVRLEARVAAHLDHLVRLGQELQLLDLSGDGLDEASFRGASRKHQLRNPGLAALNWVEPAGLIRWVEPEASNRGAVGFDLSGHPVASEAFRQAVDGDAVAVTPPLELLQGGWGLAAYLAVRRDGRTLGLLNAVFRLPDMLEGCLDDPGDDRFTYLLHDGDDLLGALGLRAESDLQLPRGQADVELAGRTLRLTVVPAPTELAAGATWVDEALLAMALVLAGSLAWGVQLARTRRQKAELASERFRVLVDNAPDAIVAIDALTGRFLDSNRRAERLLSLDQQQLASRTLVDLAPERQPDGRSSAVVMREQLDRAREGETPVFTWTLNGVAGRDVLTEIQLVRLPNRGREIIRGSITDITRRHELEVSLRRAQAHAAMGRLAGGVAHDFNNLLTAILCSTEMVVERTRDDPVAQELGRTTLETCERAGELTRQLLAFSRHSTLVPRALDLATVVSSLVPMLQRLIGEGVRIDTELGSTRAIVADRSQIELALLNLAVNARDAMPDGGRLLLRTADSGDDQLLLEVQDEGQGIAPEVLGRIFEPFFTTKGPDLGTGIGLATVKEIVEQAGGSLGVHSETGRGTTFSASFPAVEGRPEEQQPLLVGALVEGAGSVLLVEDDEAVRRTLAQTLGVAGYRVLEAASAEAGLELARGPGAAVDVLVSDIMLPGANGIELVQQVRERRPHLPVILLSGYSEIAFPPGEGPPVGVEFLAKPFAPSELLERLELVLRGSLAGGARG